MNLQSDLFYINNSFVPTRNKIVSSSPVQKNQINSNCVTLEQKSFEIFDVISIKPKKIDFIENEEQRKLEKIFNKNKSDRKYRKGQSYKNLKINKWHSFVFNRMKASIRSRNKTSERVYNKELEKHKIYIENKFPSEEPIMRALYSTPNFEKDFLLKLWDIQNGLDAYTNKPMCISDTLNSFTASCDRIDSSINYEIGNVVLCCYSTNLGKHEFHPFSDEKNSWMDYISDNDLVKKQEIRERIKRIQTLSME